MDFLQKAFSRLQPVDSEVPPEILAEQELNKSGMNQLASNTYQKLIEQKERELRESILVNYSRIKEVEKELGDLTVQLQVNVGPRKHALEMLRYKIEKQNERLSKVRVRHAAAKRAFQLVEEELAQEQAAKDQLSKELNLLVQESATAQLAKLEELKNHLEALNRGMKMATLSGPEVPDQAASSSSQQQQQQGASAASSSYQVISSSTAAPEPPAGPHPFSNAPPELVAAPSVMPPDPGAPQPANVTPIAAAPAASGTAPGSSQGAGERASTPTKGKGKATKDEQQKRLVAEVAAARAARAQSGNGSLEGLAVSLPDLGAGRASGSSEADTRLKAGNRPKDSRFSGFDV